MNIKNTIKTLRVLNMFSFKPKNRIMSYVLNSS